MINNSHQSILNRISESGLQNVLQSKRVEEKRLSDSQQDKVLNDKRVENKNRVDLKNPNGINNPTTQFSNTSKTTESEAIFESYTEAGLKGYSSTDIGTRIDIKV